MWLSGLNDKATINNKWLFSFHDIVGKVQTTKIDYFHRADSSNKDTKCNYVRLVTHMGQNVIIFIESNQQPETTCSYSKEQHYEQMENR